MFTLAWITEKELNRVIENKGDEFRRKKNMDISNTDCIFRLRGGCNCVRSEVANYERSFIRQINVAVRVDENGF